MILTKKHTITALLISSIVFLSGCMVMMPGMIDSMLIKYTNKSMRPETESVMRELISESSVALVANRGTYERVILRKIEINENLVSSEKFLQLFTDSIRLQNGWKVLNNRTILANNSENNESEPLPLLLDIQLYMDGEKLWLAMQLVDARSAMFYWSGIYAGMLPVKE
ncbi:MAG: hypothetical protein KKC46_06030 [Proteobacteria bacterium]|nr:hypothetical protein [Pseudomonadota bacterium]